MVFPGVVYIVHSYNSEPGVRRDGEGGKKTEILRSDRKVGGAI